DRAAYPAPGKAQTAPAEPPAEPVLMLWVQDGSVFLTPEGKVTGRPPAGSATMLGGGRLGPDRRRIAFSESRDGVAFRHAGGVALRVGPFGQGELRGMDVAPGMGVRCSGPAAGVNLSRACWSSEGARVACVGWERGARPGAGAAANPGGGSGRGPAGPAPPI